MEQKPYKIIFGKERLITPGGLAIVGQLMRQTALRKRLAALGKPKDYIRKYTGRHLSPLLRTCDL